MGKSRVDAMARRALARAQRDFDPERIAFYHSIRVTYGGTAPKFRMFHKRGLLLLHLVEHTKLRSCTSVSTRQC